MSFDGNECKRPKPMYSFGPSNKTPSALVPSPRPSGSTPETCGSNVPLCPIFGISRILFAHATTSWLVGPGGLSTRMRPYSKSCSVVL